MKTVKPGEWAHRGDWVRREDAAKVILCGQCLCSHPCKKGLERLERTEKWMREQDADDLARFREAHMLA